MFYLREFRRKNRKLHVSLFKYFPIKLDVNRKKILVLVNPFSFYDKNDQKPTSTDLKSFMVFPT